MFYCWIVSYIHIIHFSYFKSYSPFSSSTLFFWSLSSQHSLLLLSYCFCVAHWFHQFLSWVLLRGYLLEPRTLISGYITEENNTSPQPLLNAKNPLHNSYPTWFQWQESHDYLNIYRKGLWQNLKCLHDKNLKRLGMETLYLNLSV